jgi:ERCC4-type nuclease
MDPRYEGLRIAATRPRARVARALAELGIAIVADSGAEQECELYIVSDRVAVERRDGAAFLRGIQDKTLFTSAIYLREHFLIPLLIVEGQASFEYTSFSPQAARGALTAMVLEYGISVLPSRDVDDTVALIAMLARQEQLGIPEISLIPKRRATDLPDLQRRVVEMLPGCGRVVARDLLQHFGDVRRIATAGEEELRQAPGIGSKGAAQIHRVLNAEYLAVDTERNLEDAIAAEPSLLFAQPVTLVARQHHLRAEGSEDDVIDLAYHDAADDELILVELKRGVLRPEHEAQLRRYLDNAGRSPLLRDYLDRGSRVAGILATTAAGGHSPASADIVCRVLAEPRVTEVLAQLRARRLARR